MLYVQVTVHCAVCTVQCALCSVHFAVYTVHCELSTVHWAVCTVQCALSSVHWVIFNLCRWSVQPGPFSCGDGQGIHPGLLWRNGELYSWWWRQILGYQGIQVVVETNTGVSRYPGREYIQDFSGKMVSCAASSTGTWVSRYCKQPGLLWRNGELYRRQVLVYQGIQEVEETDIWVSRYLIQPGLL